MIVLIPMLLSSCGNEESAATEDILLTGTATAEELPKRELITSFSSLIDTAEAEQYVRTIEIRNISLDRAADAVSRAIPSIIAVKNDDSNTLIVRGGKKDIEEARRLVASIDKRTPQIFIEGKIVEVSQNGLADIGIIWGKEQGSFKFSVDKSSGAISQSDSIIGTINALIASGKASMLANPKITALDGKEAEINIGSRIPYAVPSGATLTSTLWSIQYIDAGVNLKIISNIGSDGTIVSTIRPEVSNISEWRTTAAGEFPVISTRNASVTVRLNDGETLIIGGLINETDRENVSGIAGLSEIPVVGGLFQRNVKERTKSDVLFLITPHIMR